MLQVKHNGLVTETSWFEIKDVMQFLHFSGLESTVAVALSYICAKTTSECFDHMDDSKNQ